MNNSELMLNICPKIVCPLVLCKDCRFNEIPGKANVLCEKVIGITNPYGYCSEGERRTDEQ